MKITDLKCTILCENPMIPVVMDGITLGRNPVVRITTDEGISGYGELDNMKSDLKPHVLFYKKYIVGEDPTDVERVMLKIRRMGSFKPWGSAVSAIEMALWDIAGKAANVPVYKLLGGKVRDRVRVYNGAVPFPGAVSFLRMGVTPDDYANHMKKMMECKEGFTIIKTGIGFLQGFVYGITIQFFYPYEGVENLSLSLLEKEKIINEIIKLKVRGFNILDSKTALRKMIKNNWKCEDYLVASVDPDGKINYGCYLKNRVKNISCENCGFLAHCEISLSFQLNLDALISAKKIFWSKISLPDQEEIF